MFSWLTELALGALLLPAVAAPQTAKEPVRLVFDTDMGNDIDDALALAMIHALQDRGECRLLAVTVTKDNRYSAPFIALVNRFYGHGDVPIGVVSHGATPEDGSYTKGVTVATDGGRLRYPRDLPDGSRAPDAVALLRKVLAAQPDGSVVAVQVGFSTNLARLLDSKPDAASPLPGVDLVRKKVRLLSAMAGAFGASNAASPQHTEYNVVTDLPSAKRLFYNWPTALVASGFEIGLALRYPARSIENDYDYVAHHPIREAYELYRRMPYDRPTWDLTSVLYAVRPDRGYFHLSPPGRIEVLDDGRTRFVKTPTGAHRYLVLDRPQHDRILEAMQLLCSQPPRIR